MLQLTLWCVRVFVRERSKESANCRLELNYAQQNEDVDMIPLMMEPNYKPRGWRKSLVHLYYCRYAVDIESFCS